MTNLWQHTPILKPFLSLGAKFFAKSPAQVSFHEAQLFVPDCMSTASANGCQMFSIKGLALMTSAALDSGKHLMFSSTTILFKLLKLLRQQGMLFQIEL